MFYSKFCFVLSLIKILKHFFYVFYTVICFRRTNVSNIFEIFSTTEYINWPFEHIICTKKKNLKTGLYKKKQKSFCLTTTLLFLLFAHVKVTTGYINFEEKHAFPYISPHNYLIRPLYVQIFCYFLYLPRKYIPFR